MGRLIGVVALAAALCCVGCSDDENSGRRPGDGGAGGTGGGGGTGGDGGTGGGGGTGGEGGTSHVTPENFTRIAADAVCGALFRCCNAAHRDSYFDVLAGNERLASLRDRLASVDAEECPTLLRDVFDIAPWKPWLDALAAGEVEFDAQAAAACEATLAEASCGDEAARAIWDGTCFGFDTPDGGNRRSFRRVKTEGASCDRLADGFNGLYFGTCNPQQAFCCFEDPAVMEGCLALPTENEVGTCKAVSDVGGACNMDDPTVSLQLCKTGLECVNGRCRTPVATELEVGDPCFSGSTYTALGVCQDSWCDVMNTNRCQPHKVLGESCQYPDECKSSFCWQNRCEAYYCEQTSPCADIPACEEEGTACRSQTLVSCEPEGSCLRRTETDCAATGGVCEVEGEAAACSVDPCADKPNPCAVTGTRCDGETLYTCAADVDGCLVETATDCDAAGLACTVENFTAACRPVCEDECSPAGSACVGDELVQCAPGTLGCLVQTSVTCAEGCSEAGGAHCVNDPCAGLPVCPTLGETACAIGGEAVGTCVQDGVCQVWDTVSCVGNEVCRVEAGVADCVDPCLGVSNCAAPAATCNAGVATTCAADANGCLVETQVDCGALGSTCQAAGGVATCQNALCTAAIPVTCNASFSGTTSTGTQLYADWTGDGCGNPLNPSPGKEAIFSFSNPVPASVTFSVTKTNTNNSRTFKLYLVDGTGAPCADHASCLGRTTGTFPGNMTQALTFDIAPGQTRYLVYDMEANFALTDFADYTVSVTCQAYVCGNGTLEPGEACDDGDTDAGDGCSPTCTVQAGWVCSGSPSACHAIACGDGFVDGAEACDDGDAQSGDGCSSTCTVEPGYACSGAPSVCITGGDVATSAIRLTAGTASFDITPYVNNYDNYRGACGTTSGFWGGKDMAFVVNVPAGTLMKATATANGTGVNAPKVVVATAAADVDNTCRAIADGSSVWFNHGTSARDVFVIVEASPYGTPMSSFSIAIEQTPLAGLPAGQTCQNPIRIAAPGTLSGQTTAGMSSVYDGYRGALTGGAGVCDNYPGFPTFGHGADKVFVISVPAGQALTATLNAGYTDPVIALADNCADVAGSCLGAKWQAPRTLTVRNTGAAAKDYFVVVDGWDSGPSYAGSFSLVTSIAP